MIVASDFMAVVEAAKLLGYTTQHTRLLLRKGNLRGIKIGRDWLILRESVVELNVRRGTIPLLTSQKRGRPASGQRYMIDFSYKNSKL